MAATANGGNEAAFGVGILDGHILYELLVTGPSTTINGTFQAALKDFRINNPSAGIVAS
jgi:hypothetical protein